MIKKLYALFFLGCLPLIGMETCKIAEKVDDVQHKAITVSIGEERFEIPEELARLSQIIRDNSISKDEVVTLPSSITLDTWHLIQARLKLAFQRTQNNSLEGQQALVESFKELSADQLVDFILQVDVLDVPILLNAGVIAAGQKNLLQVSAGKMCSLPAHLRNELIACAFVDLFGTFQPKERLVKKHDKELYAVAVKNNMIVCATQHGVHVWDRTTGKTIAENADLKTSIKSVGFFGDDKVLIAADGPKPFIWDFQSEANAVRKVLRRNALQQMASQERSLVEAQERVLTVLLLTKRLGLLKEVGQLILSSGSPGDPQSLALDLLYVLCAADTREVVLPSEYEIILTQKLPLYFKMAEVIPSLKQEELLGSSNLRSYRSPIGNICASDTGLIFSRWDMNNEFSVQLLNGNEDSEGTKKINTKALSGVASMCLTHDQKLVLGTPSRGKLLVFDINEFTLLTQCLGQEEVTESWVLAVSVTPHGKIVSLSSAGTLRIWDINTGKQLAVYEIDPHKTKKCAVNNEVVVLGNGSGSFNLSGMNAGKVLGAYQSNDGEIGRFEPLEMSHSELVVKSRSAVHIFNCSLLCRLLTMTPEQATNVYRNLQRVANTVGQEKEDGWRKLREWLLR